MTIYATCPGRSVRLQCAPQHEGNDSSHEAADDLQQSVCDHRRVKSSPGEASVNGCQEEMEHDCVQNEDFGEDLIYLGPARDPVDKRPTAAQ